MANCNTNMRPTTLRTRQNALTVPILFAQSGRKADSLCDLTLYSLGGHVKENCR